MNLPKLQGRGQTSHPPTPSPHTIGTVNDGDRERPHDFIGSFEVCPRRPRKSNVLWAIIVVYQHRCCCTILCVIAVVQHEGTNKFVA